MQKPNFIFITRSNSSRRKSRPSVFTLFALAILTIGLLIIGVGLAFLLFGPLLLAAGAALVVFAALVFFMLLLAWVLRRVLARVMEYIWQTAVAQALKPALTILLRELARRLVAFLIGWLAQTSKQQYTHPPRSRKKHRKRRPLLALSAT